MDGDGLRILIVGGYGVFGGRLAILLADEPRLQLVIAGRSLKQAQAFCDGMTAAARLVPALFDRNGDVTAQLRTIAPDIVVDASGPFQVYGDRPYRLVEAALALGISYLDLADGREFVTGVRQFDAEAQRRRVFVLSGVSSFPVLTAAVCRRLAKGLDEVRAITGGIAPSPYAGVGANVIRAISSYAGKPIALTRAGQPSTGYGLTETRRFTIGPPGRLPLRSTLFSLVDVPDLEVLAEEWPGVGSVWMGAGPVPEILHRCLIGLAWVVRLRVLPSLSYFAPLFHLAINTVRWGEHRGGMFVKLEGRAVGAGVERTWHLLADGDDGPFIPSMAVEAIVRKCLDGSRPPPGARPATGDLELGDYEALFERRTIYTGAWLSKPSDEAPLYKRVLGPAWEDLPREIRDLHDFDGTLVAAGRAQVDRGNGLVSRAIGWVFGFPSAGEDVPLRVTFVSRDGAEHWSRRFGARSFCSEQRQGRGRFDRLIVERFGPFAFGLAAVRDGESLLLIVRRWSVLGIPLPLVLAPRGDAYEHVRNGRFSFHVEIGLPLVGLVVRYRGWLVPETQVAQTAD